MSANENTTNDNEQEILNADGDNVVEIETPETKKSEEDFKAKYYYLAAEFDNARKRFEREKENLIKFGNDKILTSLITVVDNFDLTVNALKSDNDDKVQNIVKGIDAEEVFPNSVKLYGTLSESNCNFFLIFSFIIKLAWCNIK